MMNAFKIENGNLILIDKEEYQSLIQGTEETVPETQPLFSAALFGDSFRYVPYRTAVLTAPIQKVQQLLIVPQQHVE